MKKAIDSFLAGRVIVSYGILVKLEVKISDQNVRHGPGDLVHFNTENGVDAQKMGHSVRHGTRMDDPE